MNIKISILVPSLNVLKYIEQCLDSIIHQSMNEIEIICIDAGSTDGTFEILKEYERTDSRIKLIHSDKKSYGYQMNIGLSIAKGEYIGIVETDDFIELEMYHDLYAIAQQYNADLTIGGYYEYNTKQKKDVLEKGNSGITTIRILTKEEIRKRMLGPAAIWRGIYKRSFLLDKGIKFLETPGASYQDTSFGAKTMIAANCVVASPKCYYHYRIDNDNSSVHAKGKTFFICDEMNSIFQFVKDNGYGCDVLWSTLWLDKYIRYNWNLLRLDKQDALSFAYRMQSEFEEIEDSKLFESSEFADIQMGLKLLFDEPRAFLLAQHRHEFDLYSIDESEVVVLKARNYLLSLENQQLLEVNQNMRDEIDALTQSLSFKIGRRVLFFPKKILSLIIK